MKSRNAVVLVSLIAFALFASTVRADDRRFSATLNATDAAQTGLSRLSSDQLAVLDALVRNDLALAETYPSPKIPRAVQFSQRLSAEERRNAGLALLSDTELAQLNASVERFGHPPASSDLETSSSKLNSIMLRRDPEIHGSVSLMVGGGSHGYSEYGGAFNVTYYDPAHHFAVDFGYSEIHSSGGYCNRLYQYRRPNTILP